eukprot:6857254-Ditylum_brightwellii.AAC.1
MFTLPLIPINNDSVTDINTKEDNHLTNDASQALRHQCLSHIHNSHQAHKYADKVPLMPTSTGLDKYNTCLTCKMTNNAKEQSDTRVDATPVEQGISINFGFMIQKSKNKGQFKTLTSINSSRLVPGRGIVIKKEFNKLLCMEIIQYMYGIQIVQFCLYFMLFCGRTVPPL